MAFARKQQSLEGTETAISRDFSNEDILWESLQAAGNGVTRIGNRRLHAGNRALALLGDKVLATILVGEMDANNITGGEMQTTLSRVGSNSYLAMIGRTYGLDAFINRNPAQGGYVSDGLMATTVQAILGAVFKDSGHSYDAVREVMRTLGFFDEAPLVTLSHSPLFRLLNKASASATNVTMLLVTHKAALRPGLEGDLEYPALRNLFSDVHNAMCPLLR